MCLFLLTNIMFGQKQVSIDFSRCQDKSEVSWHFGDFNLLKNDTLYKKDKIQDLAFYEKLEPANYTIVYKNLFDEVIIHKFSVEKTEDKYAEININLCVDKLQDGKKADLFLESMQNGDSISIRFSYAGCFSSDSDLITVKKEKNRYLLVHKNKKRKIKPIELNYFIEYENELKHLKEVGFRSTLNGENEITFKAEKYSYFEPSIYWRGFSLLKHKLKLK